MSSTRKVATKTGWAWQARWRERGQARAKNFTSKRDASAYAARMATHIEHRGIGADRISVGAYFEQFMAEVESSNRSPATVSSYRKMLKLADRVLGAAALARLTPSAIDAGYAALLRGPKPLTPGTIHLLHRVLLVALNRAVKKDLIAVNPAVNASPPAFDRDEGRKIRVFSPDELTALLAAARDAAADTLAIVSLLLATGLRRAELLGLTLDDVDLDNGLLHVRGTVIEVNDRPVARTRGKSAAAQRTLALPPTVVALLRAQRARVQEAMLSAGAAYARGPVYLFPGPMGLPMPPPWLTKRLKRLMRTAGIRDPRAPCHAWSHTCGTITYDTTANVKLVQTRLGHANINTTMGIYVHSLADREREAANHFEQLLTKG